MRRCPILSTHPLPIPLEGIGGVVRRVEPEKEKHRMSKYEATTEVAIHAVSVVLAVIISITNIGENNLAAAWAAIAASWIASSYIRGLTINELKRRAEGS